MRHIVDMSDIDKTIGATATRLRKRVGMNQEDVAKAAGISRPFLSLLESGKRGWSVDLLVSVGDALGVGAAALLPASPPTKGDRAAG